MKLSRLSAIAIPTPHSTPSTATPANAARQSANSVRRQRVQAAGGAHVEQAEHGDDDHGRQGAQRHVVHEAGAGDQQHAEGDGAGQPGELAAGAHVLHDGGARARWRRWGSPERRRRRGWRRRARPAPGSGRPAGAGGRRRSARGRWCRRRTRTRSRRRRRAARWRRRAHTSGQPSSGSPEGTAPTIGSSSESPSSGDQGGGADDGDQHAGQLAGDQPQAEDHGQAAGAEGQRGRVGLVQAGDELADGADEVLGVDREAEQLGELGDDHRQGDPGQVADADGHREQLGDEPESGQAAGQHDRPDDQGEQPGERDPLVGVGSGQRDDRGGHQRADRTVGADDEDAAGAEQEVDDERDQRRVQAGDRRQPGELRVAHALGDEQGGEHDPGEQVAAQAGSAAPGQQRESRHEAPELCRVHRPTLTRPGGTCPRGASSFL